MPAGVEVLPTCFNGAHGCGGLPEVAHRPLSLWPCIQACRPHRTWRPAVGRLKRRCKRPLMLTMSSLPLLEVHQGGGGGAYLYFLAAASRQQHRHAGTEKALRCLGLLLDGIRSPGTAARSLGPCHRRPGMAASNIFGPWRGYIARTL